MALQAAQGCVVVSNGELMLSRNIRHASTVEIVVRGGFLVVMMIRRIMMTKMIYSSQQKDGDDFDVNDVVKDCD